LLRIQKATDASLSRGDRAGGKREKKRPLTHDLIRKKGLSFTKKKRRGRPKGKIELRPERGERPSYSGCHRKRKRRRFSRGDRLKKREATGSGGRGEFRSSSKGMPGD